MEKYWSCPDKGLCTSVEKRGAFSFQKPPLFSISTKALAATGNKLLALPIGPLKLPMQD